MVTVVMNNYYKLPTLLLIIFLTACKKEAKEENYLSIDSITTNNLIKEVIEEINNNYADEITREKLEEGAINGMLAFLDEHSLYINQEEFEAFNKSTRGTYLGIGIEIKQIKDGIEIVSVIEDSPAFKAGLKTADIITNINGKEIREMSIKEIYSKLNSDTIPKILLSITRNKTDKFEVNLKKSVIQMKTVKTDFIGDIAIIKINYFNENTISAIKTAIKNIKKEKSIGLIIDLRNNPGGILDQAISLANMFITNGKIVEFKSRNVEESRSIFADETDEINGIPIAVLIDKNSASGSELVAAALGENKRAVIIGEKSYGKGSLQTIIPIPGKGAIKLTTSFLYTPNGNKLNGNGVTPDILIEQRQIDQSTPQTTPNQETPPPNQEPDPTTQRAIDLLHGISALDNK